MVPGQVSQVGDAVQIELETREGGDQLIQFATRLFKQLQAVGSVPAVDMTMYEASVLPDTGASGS